MYLEKLFFGKMNFRNEHNDDLIIDGNVRIQRAVASFLRADLLFIWKAANRQQESRTQGIHRGKMV